jgi:hypothetical protein
MPFVVRDKNHRVTGLYLEPNERASELLSIDHPDVVDFLTQACKLEQVKVLLNEYDLAIPRVLEDLIDILIRNRVITFSQFPTEAQDKMTAREYLRELIRQVDRDQHTPGRERE